ncbi:hypothetical protein MAR_009057, partial [Mya arenaria]
MLRLSAFLLLGACSLGVIAGRSTYGGSGGNGGFAGLLGASRNGVLNGIGSMGAGAVNMPVFAYAPFLPNSGAGSGSFGSRMGFAGFGGPSLSGPGAGRTGSSGSYGSSGGAGIAGIAGLSSSLRMRSRNGNAGGLVNIGPNVVDFVPLSTSSFSLFPTRSDMIPVNGMVAGGINTNAGGMGAIGMNSNAGSMGAGGMNAITGGMGAGGMNDDAGGMAIGGMNANTGGMGAVGNGGAGAVAGTGMGSMDAAAMNAVMNAGGMGGLAGGISAGTASNARNTGIAANMAAVDMGAAIVAMNSMARAERNAGMNAGINSAIGGGMNSGMGGVDVGGSTGGVNAAMVSVAMVPSAGTGNASPMNLGGKGDAISGGIAGFGMQGLTHIGNGCYIDEAGNIVKLGEGVAGVAGAGNSGYGKWKLLAHNPAYLVTPVKYTTASANLRWSYSPVYHASPFFDFCIVFYVIKCFVLH